MCWQRLILCQDAVNRAAKTSEFDLVSHVAEDVIHSEVGANTVADLPALDVVTHSDDFTGHVGTGNNIIFLSEGILTPRNEEVTILTS